MSPIRGGVLHLPTSHEGRYSQSLERGLAILRTFTPERPWLGIAEIAEVLEMSRPTTHRYASTLVALDYLEQGPMRKYRLGMRAGDLGRSAIGSTAAGQALASPPRRTARSQRLHGQRGVVGRVGHRVCGRARSSARGAARSPGRLGRGSRLRRRIRRWARVLLAHLPEEGAGRGTRRRPGGLGTGGRSRRRDHPEGQASTEVQGRAGGHARARMGASRPSPRARTTVRGSTVEGALQER